MNKIFVIFLLITNLTFAQTSNDFDTVIFEFNHDYDYGKNKGIFSKKEYLVLIRISDNEYTFGENFQQTKSFDFKTIKTNNFKFKNLQFVDGEKVAMLFKELKTNKDNFNFQYIRPSLKRIKKSSIKKIIEEKEIIWKTESKIVTNKQRKKVINEILKFSQFENFIEFEKPKKNAIYGLLDGSKNLKISFVKNNETFIYKAETFHKCGQPIEILDKNADDSKIINLEVNKLIENILPKKSMFRDEFNINNITEKYIRWYIENNL